MARYTAQEMRSVSKSLLSSEVNLNFDKRDIATMLRQAADDLEREEREKKYEKKYEYAERFARSGDVDYRHYDSKNDVEHEREMSSVVVRREVGEWEELPNES